MKIVTTGHLAIKGHEIIDTARLDHELWRAEMSDLPPVDADATYAKEWHFKAVGEWAEPENTAVPELEGRIFYSPAAGRLSMQATLQPIYGPRQEYNDQHYPELTPVLQRGFGLRLQAILQDPAAGLRPLLASPRTFDQYQLAEAEVIETSHLRQRHSFLDGRKLAVATSLERQTIQRRTRQDPESGNTAQPAVQESPAPVMDSEQIYTFTLRRSYLLGGLVLVYEQSASLNENPMYNIYALSLYNMPLSRDVHAAEYLSQPSLPEKHTYAEWLCDPIKRPLIPEGFPTGITAFQNLLGQSHTGRNNQMIDLTATDIMKLAGRRLTDNDLLQ